MVIIEMDKLTHFVIFIKTFYYTTERYFSDFLIKGNNSRTG